MDEFYAMNPSVKSDCSGLACGTIYCISTYPGGAPAGFSGWNPGSSSPISSLPLATSTTPGNGISTPYTIQTSMVSNCDAFDRVVTGDSCIDIANSHAIPVSFFYSWNPAVNTDCSGLQANVYVCVGITSTAAVTGIMTLAPIQTGMVPNCNDFYKVVANDQCGQIASAHTIPLSSFYSWNPAVHTDCSGLQASEYVCVGEAGAATATITGST